MSGAAPARSTILATTGTLTQLLQEQGQPASSVCAAATGVTPAQLHGFALKSTRGSHINVAECRKWGYLSSALRLLRVCNNLCVLVTHLYGEQRFWLHVYWEEQWRGFFQYSYVNWQPPHLVSNKPDSLWCTRTWKEVCSLALTSTTLKNKIKVITLHCISLFYYIFKAWFKPLIYDTGLRWMAPLMDVAPHVLSEQVPLHRKSISWLLKNPLQHLDSYLMTASQLSVSSFSRHLEQLVLKTNIKIRKK